LRCVFELEPGWVASAPQLLRRKGHTNGLRTIVHYQSPTNIHSQSPALLPQMIGYVKALQTRVLIGHGGLCNITQ